MHRRRVIQHLDKKTDELCESITDAAVKNIMRRKSFVTGGAIVSLLTDEKVHDYDYYLLDKESVKVVAEYYVNQFLKLNPACRPKPIIIDEGDRVRIQVRSVGLVADEKSAEEAKELPKFRPVFLTDNSITLANKVQIITRFYGTPQKVHENFDFVHCMMWWAAAHGQLEMKPESLESVIVKYLNYVGSKYPLCSIIRTRKFIRRGWRIDAGQYLKMCFQVSELNLSDPIVLEDQLTGVDVAYFDQVIDYCKRKLSKDPEFKITLPWLVEVIDRIFWSDD